METIKINNLEFEINELEMGRDDNGLFIGFELTTNMDDASSIQLAKLCWDSTFENKKVKIAIGNHNFQQDFFIHCYISENAKENERYFDIQLYTM